MAKAIVTLDDTITKGLLRNVSLYLDFSFLEKRCQEYTRLLKGYKPNCSSCSRREFLKNEARILNTVRNTIRTLPHDRLASLKSLLKADMFKIPVTDDMGRRKVYTL